jgi:hypothetical protein
VSADTLDRILVRSGIRLSAASHPAQAEISVAYSSRGAVLSNKTLVK